jgi:hypothetical protein
VAMGHGSTRAGGSSNFLCSHITIDICCLPSLPSLYEQNIAANIVIHDKPFTTYRKIGLGSTVDSHQESARVIFSVVTHGLFLAICLIFLDTVPTCF